MTVKQHCCDDDGVLLTSRDALLLFNSCQVDGADFDSDAVQLGRTSD